MTSLALADPPSQGTDWVWDEGGQLRQPARDRQHTKATPSQNPAVAGSQATVPVHHTAMSGTAAQDSWNKGAEVPQGQAPAGMVALGGLSSLLLHRAVSLESCLVHL